MPTLSEELTMAWLGEAALPAETNLAEGAGKAALEIALYAAYRAVGKRGASGDAQRIASLLDRREFRANAVGVVQKVTGLDKETAEGIIKAWNEAVARHPREKRQGWTRRDPTTGELRWHPDAHRKVLDQINRRDNLK